MASWGSDNGGGDRVRAHIARTGQTFSGVPVWTPSEDDFIRLHYPNYRTLRAAFPHRTMSGIKHRVRRLDVQTKRHVWTNLEVLRLRGLYSRRASNSELLAAFPSLRLDQITSKAGHIGLQRKRRPFKMLGVRSSTPSARRPTPAASRLWISTNSPAPNPTFGTRRAE
jgi:hypothetical protein